MNNSDTPRIITLEEQETMTAKELLKLVEETGATVELDPMERKYMEMDAQ